MSWPRTLDAAFGRRGSTRRNLPDAGRRAGPHKSGIKPPHSTKKGAPERGAPSANEPPAEAGGYTKQLRT